MYVVYCDMDLKHIQKASSIQNNWKIFNIRLILQ